MLGWLSPKRLLVAVCIVLLPGLLTPKSQACWALVTSLDYTFPQLIVFQRPCLSLLWGFFWATLVYPHGSPMREQGLGDQVLLSCNMWYTDQSTLFSRHGLCLPVDIVWGLTWQGTNIPIVIFCQSKSPCSFFTRENTQVILWRKKSSSSRYYSAPTCVEKQLAETITKADVTPFLGLFHLYVYSVIWESMANVGTWSHSIRKGKQVSGRVRIWFHLPDSEASVYSVNWQLLLGTAVCQTPHLVGAGDTRRRHGSREEVKLKERRRKGVNRALWEHMREGTWVGVSWRRRRPSWVLKEKLGKVSKGKEIGSL